MNEHSNVENLAFCLIYLNSENEIISSNSFSRRIFSFLFFRLVNAVSHTNLIEPRVILSSQLACGTLSKAAPFAIESYPQISRADVFLIRPSFTFIMGG